MPNRARCAPAFGGVDRAVISRGPRFSGRGREGASFLRRPSVANAIVVGGLVKTYGELHAVDGVDFAVGAGEVFSFLGPNGAGKTTTVEILEGLRRRSKGDVRVLGFDPWTQMDSLRQRIGVIPQDFHFFPKLSPREAILLYGHLFGVRPDADDLLAQVELSDKSDDHFEALSGGQRQKLGVALSLVNDPEVCFLDEPTTGLDPRARRSIWEVIQHLKSEGRSVFLTTHYLDEAQQLSDRIAIIHHGKIIADGAPEEIIRRFGRPQRLFIAGSSELRGRLRTLGLSATATDGGVEVELTSVQEGLTVLQAVAASGLSWESFSTRTDTLEDVFIRMVGRLEDGTARPDGRGTEARP